MITQISQQSWQAMEDRFATVTDRLGMPIDPGIRELVISLNLLGLPTVMSCEGHLDHSLAAPWVDIEDEGQEVTACQRQATVLFQEARLLHKQGKDATDLFEQGHKLQRQALLPQLRLRQTLISYLVAFYADRASVAYETRLIVAPLPGGRSRLISQGADLQEIASEEERAKRLSSYQLEMRAFTDFLKHCYFEGADLLVL